jgi:hypothetical protein
MDNRRRTVSFQDYRNAICRRHGNGYIDIPRDYCVRFAEATGAIGLHNNRTVDLIDKRPRVGDPEFVGDQLTSFAVDPEITNVPGPKSCAGEAGRPNHP